MLYRPIYLCEYVYACLLLFFHLRLSLPVISSAKVSEETQTNASITAYCKYRPRLPNLSEKRSWKTRLEACCVAQLCSEDPFDRPEEGFSPGRCEAVVLLPRNFFSFSRPVKVWLVFLVLLRGLRRTPASIVLPTNVSFSVSRHPFPYSFSFLFVTILTRITFLRCTFLFLSGS
jgi:hypothetical protein